MKKKLKDKILWKYYRNKQNVFSLYFTNNNFSKRLIINKIISLKMNN